MQLQNLMLFPYNKMIFFYIVESLVVGCIFGKTNLEAGWAT
jgi:hypothetical protein